MSDFPDPTLGWREFKWLTASGDAGRHARQFAAARGTLPDVLLGVAPPDLRKR